MKLALKQAIEQRQSNEKDQKSFYLKQRIKDLVIGLEKSDQITDIDLTIYLRGLIEQERNPADN